MSDVASTLSAWMPLQRWYAAKGVTPRLRIIATLESRQGDSGITTYFVIDEGPTEPVLYQVPVVAHSSPVAELEHALIGTVGDEWLYDAPHDPYFAAALLRAIGERAPIIGQGASAQGESLTSPGRVIHSRVLSGEQSNTSIICEVEGAAVPAVIAKVFRVLHHGENPDVTTQAALTEAGSRRVPASFGFVTASWPDPGRGDGSATGHLAFVQEFLPGLEDAWRVALVAAAASEDFTAGAFDLGVATAEVHATLATAMPTVEAGELEITDSTASMRARLDLAAAEVPAVGVHAARIHALYDAIESLHWPLLQRIHGDYHLGQVLDAHDRGWVLLDFEGEPLRPMVERSRADVTLRDVAGMLRSFDYVAGALAHGAQPIDARQWSSAARNAFLDGYISGTGVDLRADRALLDAFEIDKAVYEAVYESRNRPDWLGIPLAAIERLVERSAS